MNAGARTPRPTDTSLPARTPQIAAALFAGVWLVCAWRPWYPQDWALENVLALLTAWWLVRRHRRSPLSSRAYLQLLLFGIAHEIGAHYTYAEVPYDSWAHSLTGVSVSEALHLSRNHYDRLVHFLFGLLCYRPLLEVVGHALPVRSSAARIFPATVIATISLLYELIEWAAAMIFGGDLGMAYLGTQGDIWDAQKDSALALLGAAIACGFGLWRARAGAPR